MKIAVKIVLLCCLIAAAIPVRAAITVVSHVAKNGTGNSAAIDTTGASLIVVQVNRFGVAPTAPTDSAGNTWTGATNTCNSAGSLIMRFYYVANPTTSATHTFATSGTGTDSILVVAFSGTLTVNPLDTTAEACTNAGADTTNTSVTPAVSGSLILSGTSYNAAGKTPTVTDNDGATTIAVIESYTASASYEDGSIAWREYGSTSAIQVSWTITSNPGSTQGVVTFKPAVVGAAIVSQHGGLL